MAGQIRWHVFQDFNSLASYIKSSTLAMCVNLLTWKEIQIVCVFTFQDLHREDEASKARHANSLWAVNAVFCAPRFFSAALGCAVKAGKRLEINFRQIFDFVCVVVGDTNIWEIFAPRIEQTENRIEQNRLRKKVVFKTSEEDSRIGLCVKL